MHFDTKITHVPHIIPEVPFWQVFLGVNDLWPMKSTFPNPYSTYLFFLLLLFFFFFWGGGVNIDTILYSNQLKIAFIISQIDPKMWVILGYIIIGFLKLLSTHPIHIVVWENFPLYVFSSPPNFLVWERRLVSCGHSGLINVIFASQSAKSLGNSSFG